MAKVADFYAQGPYLHHDPNNMAPPANSPPDLFEKFTIEAINKELDKNYLWAQQELSVRARQALQFEKGFYAQFGVTGPGEFSKKYLVDLRPEALTPEQIAEIFENGSLAQRIIYIINKQDILNHVLGRSAMNAGQLISDTFGQDVADSIMEQLQEGGIEEDIGPSLISLVARSLSNIKGAASHTRDGIVLRLSSKDALSPSDKNWEKKLQKFIQQKDRPLYDRQKGYREALKLVREKINNDFNEASKQVLQSIKKDLNNTDLIPDKLFKDNMGLKKEIISEILLRIEKFLKEQITAKGGLFFKSYFEASGGLFNLGLEMGFYAEFSQDQVETIIRSIGSRRSKRIDSSRNPELPSDLNINEFMVQLKSSRSRDRLIKLRRAQTMKNTFNDLFQTGIMSGDDIDRFKYLLVNYIHRSQQSELDATLVRLINWGVEIFVRSGTVSSLLGSLSNLPIGPAQQHSYYNITVAQNHFWVVNNVLIPISSFLFATLDVMEEYKDIHKWYSVESEITGPEYDSGQLYRQKLKQHDSVLGTWYQPGVINAGIVAGNAVFKGIKMPNVSLSYDFVDAINALFTKT